jgi:hypothetical protein
VKQVRIVDEEPRIFPYNLLRVGRVATLLGVKFAAVGGHAERLILAHGKRHGIDEVNSPIGDASPADVIKITPAARMVALVEGNSFHRTEPEVPIEVCRRSGIGGSRALSLAFVNPALHIVNVAEIAALDHLRSSLEMGF